MRFEEQDMFGPFEITEVGQSVPKGYIGVYILSCDRKKVDYVGRSDSDIQGRLRSSISEGHGYQVFWFCYETSSMQAYKHECYLYHKYNPPDNTNHPAVPSGMNWRCPINGCPWGL